MRIAITGSRGFIGGTFGRHAVEAGHQVLGIGRCSQPDPDWPGEYVHADSLHSDLSTAFRSWRPEAVLHAAGSASVDDSLAEPLQDLRASVMTLGNTIEGIRRSGVAPVLVIPSSAAVYGNPATLPVAETSPVAPISPFGFHKAACELLAHEAAECYGLHVVVCRLFSIYGPRQRRRWVWEAYRQLESDANVVELDGTGSETRDFLHVDDASAAMLALMRHPKRGCTIVNVGSGTKTSVAQLVEEMKRVSDTDKMLMCRGVMKPGDPLHLEADINQLRALAPAWHPRALRDGLTETLTQWRGGG